MRFILLQVLESRIIRPKPEETKEKVALILCSSGTTGLPKGVELTQDNILVCVNHWQYAPFKDRIPNDEICLLGVIPWFHSFGCITMIALVCLGFPIVIVPKFEERSFLSCIEVF